MNSVLYDSFSGQLQLLRYFGVHPFPNWSRFWFNVYAFTSYAVLTFPFPVNNAIACYLSAKTDGDIQGIAGELFVTLQCIACVFKHLHFKVYPERIASTLEWLNKPIFNAHNTEQNDVVKSTVNFCRKVFKMYCTMAIVCFAIWISKPFFQKERSLSLRMIVPFDLFKNDFVFWSCHLYQVTVVSKGLWCNVAIDTMIPGLIWQVAGQVKILKNNLRDIVKQTDRQIAEKEKTDELGMEKEKLRHMVIYAKISDCVMHHNAIKEYVKELEAVYSSPLFFQLLISVLVICVTLFELSIVSVNDIMFFEMLSFLPAILYVIFFFCYCGEVLCEESLSITKYISDGDWLEMDTKSRKAICLIMVSSKKPLIIKAGGIIDLSLETFQTIMSRSYSLLAVLNTMDSTK